jgi:electron transfer flavoprotein alpha subunit
MSHSILVVADHDNTQLNSATLSTLQAAAQIKALTGSPISLLIAGFNCSAVSEAGSKIAEVDHIIYADDSALDHHLAENIAALVLDLVPDKDNAEQTFSHILAPATTTGKNILPRVAALLDCSQISEIIAVQSQDIFVRPIYAGNALARVQSNDKVKVMSVRASAFEAVNITSGCATINTLQTVTDTAQVRFISEDNKVSDRIELSSASAIISGGRGMQNSENFAMLERVADKIGAAVGASRAAVDAGFVCNDMQVGQTGKIVAPDLYIAVGISGAIQHLAGMKDSKVIVAINKDEEAPIFGVADYGLVADLFEAVPQLEQQL